MRRFVAVLVGALGVGALVRRRRRPAPAGPESSPADDLRAKLAETRAAEKPEDDLDARRREVHEQARQSLDELG